MRAFAQWAWVFFLAAGGIYFYLYFTEGRSNAFQFAIGTAFLVLAGLNFARSRRRAARDTTISRG
ncbi:MAG: hypothetical protein M3365_07685 [Gemmatimonadota bacterium]|nr:hypothetical protein [Gemmatimonadota bacterium]